MELIDRINHFLQLSEHELGKLSAKERGPGIRPFVTISRQAGAGGHTVAEALLEAFSEQEDKELFGDWQLFDEKLVEMVGDVPDLKVSLESLLMEDYETRADDFFRQVLTSTTPQDMVMQHIFRIVRHLAEVGKVIIVGRAGSQATRGLSLSPSVSVCLVAPKELRVKRLMEVRGLDKKQARKLTDRYDASRARLLKRHFKLDVDDPLLYDITLNTAEVSEQDIAQAITAVIRTRAASFHAKKPVKARVL